jgi:hypothetical protein
MPAPEPLLKDTNRLLSLAAFVFSVATGLFAVYQTMYTRMEATVDTVNKLIDQYYDEQEKLTKMNEEDQIALMNLLRSRAQSTALRMFSLATSVKASIDDRTWQAVAQINDGEGNIKAAERAWLIAIENTKDISVYLYANRNLASNQLRQGRGREEDANRSYQSALDAALSKQVEGTTIVNEMPQYAKSSEAALTHAYWLDQFNRKDCSFVVSHFDSALEFVADVSHYERTGRSGD